MESVLFEENIAKLNGGGMNIQGIESGNLVKI